MQEKTFDAFSDELKAKFVELFPISAWGPSKFKIIFKAVDMEVRISRGSYNEEVNNNIRIVMSPSIKLLYKEALDLVKSAPKEAKSGRHRAVNDFEVMWKIRDQVSILARRQFATSFPSNLTFIPAGRSFFTSLGKAFAAFDGRFIDPITARFGRMYSSMVGEGFYVDSPKSREIVDDLAQILGGEISRQNDRVTIKCADGREIPVSALSSGQQEILPLLVAFEFLTVFTRHAQGKSKLPEITIIEEPEAHLFPSAQSRLVQALVGFVNTSPNRVLLLTTHSPYVLSKINNLIKAGDLDTKLPKQSIAKLADIIPRRSRLAPGSIRAYAIKDGVTVSIIGEEGLIEADYLDEISNEIGTEFAKLLELEYSGD